MSAQAAQGTRRTAGVGYHDPTGNIAAARVDRQRERSELGVIAGMAIQSLLSRRASNEQLADMVRGLSPWWDGERGAGLSRRAWRVTDHAASRAVEMNLTPEQITALLESPEGVVEQGPESKYEGELLHFRGDHAAAVGQSTAPRSVITFLYRYQDDYEAQYAAPAAGREARPWSHLPRKAA